MKVELLNKARNTFTGDTIRTFLLEGYPKYLLAQIGTHRIISQDAEIECAIPLPKDFSRNSESSRARPIGSVISQVMMDPYIPKFTGKAKGMQGVELSDEVADRALYRWLNARDNAVTQAQELMAIGVHKQDANRLLEPWAKVSLMLTATEWDNFYLLRNHPEAQPAFQEFAAEMERLDTETEAQLIKPGEWYKPWPDLSIYTNVSKSAGISYANHNKDRADEDHARIHQDILESKPLHASPTEHCAIAIIPGQWINSYQVFDSHNIALTLEECPDNDNHKERYISTANFGGFLQYRKLIESNIPVNLETERVG